MIESIITSKTRINLLLKFFLNSQTKSYLRSLEFEFRESSNSVRVELNRLESAGLLASSIEGNKKMFFANTAHPLFTDINNIIKKHIGIDQITSKVFAQIPGLKLAYLTGDIATGKNSDTLDFILIGDKLDEELISKIIAEIQPQLPRKLKYSTINFEEQGTFQLSSNSIQIWQSKF